MTSGEMIQRLRDFALQIARLSQALPDSFVTRVYRYQLIRASSSAGANYRASQRAKSKADFINKRKIVEEELDESLYFLELLTALYPDQQDRLVQLHKEGEILLRIIVASLVTARRNSLR
jgi:four helix bundle protein